VSIGGAGGGGRGELQHLPGGRRSLPDLFTCKERKQIHRKTEKGVGESKNGETGRLPTPGKRERDLFTANGRQGEFFCLEQKKKGGAPVTMEVGGGEGSVGKGEIERKKAKGSRLAEKAYMKNGVRGFEDVLKGRRGQEKKRRTRGEQTNAARGQKNPPLKFTVKGKERNTNEYG